MNRFAIALLGGLALAATAASAEDTPQWRRLAATAAKYNASAWVRLEGSGGRTVWIQAGDAAKLIPHRGRPRRVVVLWPDSIPHVAHVGEGVRYMISEQTYDCGRRRMTEHNFFFHPDGSLMAERVPEPGEFTEGDLVYQAVCKGAGVRVTKRWSSAAEVIANEPDAGLE